MSIPADWYAFRRADGESVGWIAPHGDGFRALDLLGRTVGVPPVDWLDAEELLEQRGISYLADRYHLRLADSEVRPVRIAEVSTDGIVVVADEFGAASAVGAAQERFRLPFPAPDELRSD